MGANDDIELTLSKLSQGGLCFLGCIETTETSNSRADRIKSLRKTTKVLLTQYGCWYQNSDLLTGCDALSGRMATSVFPK